jgi:hypothetical protein
MLPCRQYHSYRKYKNRVSVAAKAIFLKEISKGFIIGHPSITVRERILFKNNGVNFSDVGYTMYIYTSQQKKRYKGLMLNMSYIEKTNR